MNKRWLCRLDGAGYSLRSRSKYQFFVAQISAGDLLSCLRKNTQLCRHEQSRFGPTSHQKLCNIVDKNTAGNVKKKQLLSM